MTVRSRSDAPTTGGLFITFEGGEGSGKSTQIARLARRLEGSGMEVVATREPGGTQMGSRLRALLLEPGPISMPPIVELLLYAADRAQHIVELIQPALDRGALVLCDRYLDATLTYQGCLRGLGSARILDLHAVPPLNLRPRRTVLLDLDPDEALARARMRNAQHARGRAEGRFEAEDLDFHRKVREGYLGLARAEPDRIRLVAGHGDPDEVEARVAAALADLLPLAGARGGA